MSLFVAMALCGMAFGLAACLLGVAQLTCEHAGAPLAQRLTTLALALVAGWTAIDCWDAWSGVRPTVDSKAVAFSIALALSWGYRRFFRIGSTPQPRARAETL